MRIDKIKSVMPFGEINYFESVDSTNDWLIDNGECGDICISEAQAHGRGRQGNKWISPKEGNIYFSLCWCFDDISKHWTLLGLVVGIAIAEALSDVGLRNHGVKWPNDIFWDNKKLGGILIETVGRSSKVIIGIGLNISLPEKYTQNINQAATSLEEALPNSTPSRDELLMALVIRLHQSLKSFSSLTFDNFLISWKKWDILQGEIISFSDQGKDVVGKVVEIDQHGRLGLLNSNGEVKYFSSAEIKMRRVGNASTSR